MVAPVFEHITAIMVVGMLFVSAVVAVPAISYVNLLYVDQQQLRNIALEALNSMLLGMGVPSDWGSSSPFNENDTEKFGLALSESSSFYVLDPNKVQRLVVNPSGYLDYSDVRDLLELQGYGFNIRIVPPFNVIVTLLKSQCNGDDLLLSFNVAVRFNGGEPIPNATIEATTLYVQNDMGMRIFETSPRSTDELGLATINETLESCYEHAWGGHDYIVVFKTTVGGMSTVTAYFSDEWGAVQQLVQSSIVGDTLTLWIPDEMPEESEVKFDFGVRRVENLYSVSSYDVMDIDLSDLSKLNRTFNHGKGSPIHDWTHTFHGLSYGNPIFLIGNIKLPIWKEGSTNRLFVFLNPNWMGYRISNFNSNTPSNSGAIKLSRNVEIGGMRYIFEFWLWKET